MKLTVAIPTFNRNEILKYNLTSLLPQLTTECKLLIIDNCSSIPVSESLQPLLSKYPNTNIQVIRNRVNIGGNANILRCFELCETEWIWVLGDDDSVKQNAIETIFSVLQDDKKYCFINFYSEAPSHPIRVKHQITKGLNEFIEKFDYLGSVLFLSTSIFNRSKLVSNFQWAYQMMTSCAPHLVLLLMSLGKSEYSYLSPKQIVTNGGSTTTPLSLQQNAILPALGLAQLLDIPLDPIARYHLKIQLSELLKSWITPKGIINLLVHKGFFEGNSEEAYHLYTQISQRLFSLNKQIPNKILIFIGYFFVRYPNISKPIADHLHKFIKGKDYEYIENVRG